MYKSMHSDDNVTYQFKVKSSSDITDSPWYGEDTKCNECVILWDNVCMRYENVQGMGKNRSRFFNKKLHLNLCGEMKID